MKSHTKNDPSSSPILDINNCLIYAEENVFIFPTMMVNINIDSQYWEMFDYAFAHTQAIFVAVYKVKREYLSRFDLHPLGVLVQVEQVVQIGENQRNVFLRGLKRKKLEGVFHSDRFYRAVLSDPVIKQPIKDEKSPLILSLDENFQQFMVQFKNPFHPEILQNYLQNQDVENKLFIVISFLKITNEQKLELLQLINIQDLCKKTLELLQIQLDVVKIQKNIVQKVNQKIVKQQKDYFLQEQIKEMQKQLERSDPEDNLEKLIQQGSWPVAVAEKLNQEWKRLQSLPAVSPEVGLLRAYLECLVKLPWHKSEKEDIDLKQIQVVLNNSHYGMDAVKERILDFLSLRKFHKDYHKGTVICMVGPPGTGKTSLAKAIAKALNKKFVRLSLGGLKDEAEIKGHRRTYIGAMPGKIIQMMGKAKTQDPVFLLDEIDKIGKDFRGDPASALLEVLDYQQNQNFQDHYIELEFDLSSVIFITTANNLDTIPPPLLDRMEVISIEGYSYLEKRVILKEYTIPYLKQSMGLNAYFVHFQDEALEYFIEKYGLSSGLRELQRLCEKILTQIVRQILEEKKEKQRQKQALFYHRWPHMFQFDASLFYKMIGIKEIQQILGPPSVYAQLPIDNKIGLIYGLAWSTMGGRVLLIEVQRLKGQGKMRSTGSLGNVMSESAKIAFDVAQAAIEEAFPQEALDQYDFHIHFPEGATPKDGPSAGISIACAFFSCMRGKLPLKGLAMTGELTLKGFVLPVGGIKEKVLAAYRMGLTQLILPAKNTADYQKIHSAIRQKVSVHFVDHIAEVFEIVFPPVQKKIKSLSQKDKALKIEGIKE